MSPQPDPSGRLHLIAHILESAFFSPLNKNDWPAYFYGRSALLGLEDEEVFDLFVRGAVAAEILHPDLPPGRKPYAWLLSVEDKGPLLAQVLASLRADRPLLFHRVLLSLPGVTGGGLDPKEFELVEDYLQAALRDDPGELATAAAAELEAVFARGRRAVGFEDELPGPGVEQALEQVLARPGAARVESDQELLRWLIAKGGLEGVEATLAPQVLVWAWRRYCASVLCLEPDLAFLTRLNPHLDLSVEELALHAPPVRDAGHMVSAACPICHAQMRLKLGPVIQEEARCGHLVFVGTSDEAHLWEVLRHFSVGEDINTLMASYYQSPADLDLFSTVANDLFELLRGQDRVYAVPVKSSTAGKAFYNVRAYFAAPPGEETEFH